MKAKYGRKRTVKDLEAQKRMASVYELKKKAMLSLQCRTTKGCIMASDLRTSWILQFW